MFSVVKNNQWKRLYNKKVLYSELLISREKSLALQRDNFLKLSLKNNGIQIKKNNLLKDINGVEFPLNKMLKSKKIVFRYSELHCDACVDVQIKSLKKYKEKIGSTNILILADYDNIKNLILFKRLNSIKLPVYKLSEKLNIELEKQNVPYFFVLDTNFVAKDFFIPIKEIENYTDNYLEIISKKHFEDKY